MESVTAGGYELVTGELAKEIEKLKLKSNTYKKTLEKLDTKAKSTIGSASVDPNLPFIRNEIQKVKQAALEVQRQAEKVKTLVQKQQKAQTKEAISKERESSDLQEASTQSKLDAVLKVADKVEKLAQDIITLDNEYMRSVAETYIRDLEIVSWPPTRPSLAKKIYNRFSGAFQWVKRRFKELTTQNVTVITPTAPPPSSPSSGPLPVEPATSPSQPPSALILVEPAASPSSPISVSAPMPAAALPSLDEMLNEYLEKTTLTTTQKQNVREKFTRGLDRSREDFLTQLNSFKDNKERLYAFFMQFQEKSINEMIDVLNQALVEQAIAQDQTLEPARLKSEVAHRESDDYFKRILSKNYTLDKCPSDGDCLFHAFSKALIRHPLDIRKEMSAYMLRNEKQLLSIGQEYGGYQGIVVESGPDRGEVMNSEIFKKEAHQMAQHSVDKDGWGELRHVRLLAALYNLTVYIHIKGQEDIVINDQPIKRVLHLHLHGDNHWDRLIPIRHPG